MLLHLCTWKEIDAYLKRSQTIIIPIGSNEQHGPTGLLGTDWMCPEIIAHQAQQQADLLITPTFNIGMAQHHLGFSGTIALRPSTFMAAISDWSKSLALQGFKRVYFLNGHGGNIPSIEAAFSEIYAEASYAGKTLDFKLRLRNWWDLPGVMDRVRALYPTGHGSHAQPSEISVTQWAYSDHIKRDACEPEIAPDGLCREATDFRKSFPDGRMGSNPLLATPEAGGELVALAVCGLMEDIETRWTSSRKE